MFACYERSFDRKWKLVVYSEKPAKSVNGTSVERTSFIEVPKSCLVAERPSLTLIQDIFPAPSDEI